MLIFCFLLVPALKSLIARRFVKDLYAESLPYHPFPKGEIMNEFVPTKQWKSQVVGV